MKAKWLFSKRPLVVDVDLASAIGLNEAIVVQQLNYWLHSKSAKQINGRMWIYNTYANWKKDNFPFWSTRTIRRALDKCIKKKIILTGNFNKAGFDKTKWYSIDFDELNKLVARRCGQNGQTEWTKWPDGSGQNGQTNTRDYTETTTETNNNSQAKPDKGSTHLAERKEIIEYLNHKLGTNYKVGAKTNARHINARLNKGYTVDDFKKVIDIKYDDWANNPKMAKYLRPGTLFKPDKFENYLNEWKMSNAQNSPGHRDYQAELNEWNEGN